MADDSKPTPTKPRPAERVCVVVGRTRHKMVQAEIQEAARRGARLIELRLDFLAKAPDFKRLLGDKPCPMVATVRRPDDGGRWPGTEEARQTLLRQCIVSGFDWVDLETDVADTIRRYKDVRRIVSYHNMREVPADLEGIHARMCEQDADVVKIAARVQHPAENLRLLALVKGARKPTVALGLGDLAMPSRILGALYGAPFTYAAFNKERGIAPGLPSFDEVHRLYFYDLIDGDTKVYGVVGDPVAHSLGPLVHNLAFRKLGVNAVYVPFRVPRDTLTTFIQQHERLPVHGYSVTIPHKETAAALAQVKDTPVSLTGAANTLVRQSGGGEVQWAAHNTDYTGALEALLAVVAGEKDPTNEEAVTSLQSRPTLVLGAGGVARAIAHGLNREGALITIASRTGERSRKLADELSCRWVEWNARHSHPAHLVVNCTPVGMHPKVDESPLHNSYLKPGQIVFDTVYNPETTLLVREARERGCLVITGVELFVRQAAAQVKLFTGREAPAELLYKVVKRALSPVTIREEE